MTDVSIEHLWVKVNIGGTWYQFDPSYKPHVVKFGVDLGVAAGYSAASFLSTANSGATVTPDQVRGLNRNGTRSELHRLSTNLATWIRKNKPTATIGDIVGGNRPSSTDVGKLGSKRHIVVDARGIPLAITVTGATDTIRWHSSPRAMAFRQCRACTASRANALPAVDVT